MNNASSEKGDLAQKLDNIAWAVFFIWVGIAMLTALSWEWFLLGVGIVILAAQFARWQIGARIEGFWVACGAIFLAGGMWTVLQLPWSLGPILLILLGVVLLGKTIGTFLRPSRDRYS